MFRLPWSTDYLKGSEVLSGASVQAAVEASPLKYRPHILDDSYLVMDFGLLKEFVEKFVDAPHMTYGALPWFDCDDFRDLARADIIRSAYKEMFPAMPAVGGVEFEKTDGKAHAQMFAVAKRDSKVQMFMYEPQRWGDSAWEFNYDKVSRVRFMEV